MTLTFMAPVLCGQIIFIMAGTVSRDIIGPLRLSYEKDEQLGVPSEAIIIRFGETFMAHNNLDLEI